MPEICRFLGITIKMYYNDHEPPHFHAEYGDYRIKVTFDGIVEGRFPKRALGFVLEWGELRKHELEEDWKLAKERRPLKSVAPLE